MIIIKEQVKKYSYVPDEHQINKIENEFSWNSASVEYKNDKQTIRTYGTPGILYSGMPGSSIKKDIKDFF